MPNVIVVLTILFFIGWWQSPCIAGEPFKEQGHKYENFKFSPEWSDPNFGQYFITNKNIAKPWGVMSEASKRFLNSIVGDLSLTKFSFHFYGALPQKPGINFVRGHIRPVRFHQGGRYVADPEVIASWNRFRKQIGAEPVSKSMKRLNIFGLVKDGKLILPVEQRKMPIEKERHAGVGDDSRTIPGANHSNACKARGLLFADDINLDGHPEFFYLNGFFAGAGIKGVDFVNNGYTDLTLHINDGLSGKHIFSAVLKETSAMRVAEKTGVFAIADRDFNVGIGLRI